MKNYGIKNQRNKTTHARSRSEQFNQPVNTFDESINNNGNKY